MINIILLLLILLLIITNVSSSDSSTNYKEAKPLRTNDDSMPLPFTREITITDPLLYGNDVLIATTLLSRSPYVKKSYIPSNTYDDESSEAVSAFQTATNLNVNGIIDAPTANLLLNLYSNDGYQDKGVTAGSMGYLYKIVIPVYSNRSIESTGTLYDKDNNVLLSFTVRAHGHRDDGSSAAWPDFGDGDVGLTQFAGSGATVTGLIAIDLNTPESDPQLYGPWPVNRFVRGIDGNAKLLLPHIRDGILIHTGNWTTDTKTWNPTMSMPNSAGCIHAHPTDIERIYKELTKIGVVANENPFSGQNYPYEPQGIAIVQQMD
jgi:hypothetical protein